MSMGPRARGELAAMLAAACRSSARLIVYFPPDQTAIVQQYRQTDAAGLDAFKRDVGAEVARHNANCSSQAGLFDFLQPNALTTETMVKGSSPDYVDLVHVRPPAGLWLLRQMGVTGD